MMYNAGWVFWGLLQGYLLNNFKNVMFDNFPGNIVPSFLFLRVYYEEVMFGVSNIRTLDPPFRKKQLPEGTCKINMGEWQ